MLSELRATKLALMLGHDPEKSASSAATPKEGKLWATFLDGFAKAFA